MYLDCIVDISCNHVDILRNRVGVLCNQIGDEMQMMPGNSMQTVKGLIESYGLEASVVAAEAGLDPNILARTNVSVETNKLVRFLEIAAKSSGDRFFSLKLAQLIGWDLLGPIWLLIRSAGTAGKTLQVIADHLELYSQALTVYTIKEGGGTSFCFDVRGLSTENDPSQENGVQLIEVSLAMACNELRTIFGEQWSPSFVQFRHDAPDNLAPMKRVFGDKIFFNQDHNAIHLTQDECDYPLPELWSNQRKFLKQEIESRHDHAIPFSLKVDKAIRLMISDQPCSVQQIAKILSLSPRTLQYKLKQEGLTYQTLVDRVRVEVAMRYLESSNLSTGAIAERLHFAETAVFSRFYKRHTGMTPKEMRQHLENKGKLSD